MILSLTQLLLHKHGKARNQATINEHIQNDKSLPFYNHTFWNVNKFSCNNNIIAGPKLA